MKLVRIDLKTGLRAQAGSGDTIIDAFKPNEEPDDAYSVIGIASPEATQGGGVPVENSTAEGGTIGSGPPIPDAGMTSGNSGGGGVW